MTTQTLLAERPLRPAGILRVGSWSIRVAPRTVVVVTVMLIVLLGMVALTLLTGGLELTAQQVWSALLGEGEPAAIRSIQGRRLPRALTAIGVGGCLGISGALFQSLSRNVLGSPDIIGFTTGAAAGAAIQLMLFGENMVATAVAAVTGGTLTAVFVYIASRKGGSSAGSRFVLVGVGTGAMLGAVIELLIVKASLDKAQNFQMWRAGSLLGRGWVHACTVLAIAAVFMPVVSFVARRLTLAEMGDDTASSLGVNVERYRLAGIVLGVMLVGVAVAAAGPIAFVALAAPQIARRLAHTSAILVVASFVTGAVLLVAADLLAQNLNIGLRTPVGLVTSLLGGVYLIWLLATRA